MPRKTTLPRRKTPRGPALEARKQPRQQRSQAMVDTILEAATRVLRQDSLAGFNTNRVAAVAGISVGSLYQYFPNKSALVAALIERAQADLADALERQVAALAGESLETSFRALADLAIQQQYGDAVFAAALDHEEKRLPLQSRINPARLRMVATVTSLLHAHDPSLPESSALDCLLLAKALVEAHADDAAPPPPGLKHRIVCALSGYVGQVSAASSRNSPF